MEHERNPILDDVDSETKMELSRILKDNTSESDSDVDNPQSIEKIIQSSPVFGGVKK